MFCPRISRSVTARAALAWLFLVGFSAASAMAQTHDWSKRLGGSGTEAAQDVWVDGAGNVLLSGYFFSSSIDLGGGPLVRHGDQDGYFVKYDNAGNHLWSRRYGEANASCTAVASDGAGNVYVAGWFTGDIWVTPTFGYWSWGSRDIFLVKYDATGNYLWSKHLGGQSTDYPLDLVIDPTGNVLLGGNFEGTVDFGGGPVTGPPGNYPIFLAKYDSGGSYLWAQVATGDNLNGVAVDAAGSVFIAGDFHGSTQFGTSNGAQDIFLAAYNSAGAFQWSRTFGGSGIDGAAAVTVDASGNPIITGGFRDTVHFGGSFFSSAGGSDIFVAGYDGTDGSHAWSRAFGAANDDVGLAVAADPCGNVYVAGTFRGTVRPGGPSGPAHTSAGGDDVLVVAYGSATGAYQWSNRYGSTGGDQGSAVALDGCGRPLLAGTFQNTVDFGGNPFTASGITDVFLARYYAPLVMSDVSVTSTFNPGAYTWDATVAFHTNIPTTGSVQFDPAMDCFPPCAHNQEVIGPTASDHAISLPGLPASTRYCFRAVAAVSGWPVCAPACQVESSGTFQLDNANGSIYSIGASFLSANCKIRVSWKSKFPSTNNILYWRPVGGGSWSTVAATQSDCIADRSYTAAFLVAPTTDYEYKVQTVIDGVSYESAVYTKRSGRCDTPPEFESKRGEDDIVRLELRAHPNPFNPMTTVVFATPEAGEAVVKIYSATGRYVTTLAAGWYERGIHRLQWKGVGADGTPVASGTYYARLQVGPHVLTSKLILLR